VKIAYIVPEVKSVVVLAAVIAPLLHSIADVTENIGDVFAGMILFFYKKLKLFDVV
jgi:hypothetical protein